MDLNGDGIVDLITGCFEGGSYVMDGQGGGKYSAPRAVLDKSGAILRLGQYWDEKGSQWTGVDTSKFKETLGISVVAVDWDADGDQDLIIGGYDGRIFLRLNDGTAKKPEWQTESTLIEAGGEPVAIKGRSAIPTVGDLDGDGLWDIVTGSGAGNVYFLKNTGKKGAPTFAKPKLVVHTRQSTETRVAIGKRTQVNVVDFDGDGRADILVGDYRSVTTPAPNITKEQKAEKKKLDEKRNELLKKFSDLAADGGRIDMEKPEIKAMLEELGKIDNKLRPLKGGRKTHGFVWLARQLGSATDPTGNGNEKK